MLCWSWRARDAFGIEFRTALGRFPGIELCPIFENFRGTIGE